jgi:putative transposase
MALVAESVNPVSSPRSRREPREEKSRRPAVYAKPPFGGPERAPAHLARYTHRTAISNSRLVAVTDAEVAFRYKNYRLRRPKRRHAARPAREFIRRFLLHVPPDGFHRIRRYGFLAKADRGDKLARVRELLRVQAAGEGRSLRRRGAATQKPTSFATPPCAARIAGASCAH